MDPTRRQWIYLKVLLGWLLFSTTAVLTLNWRVPVHRAVVTGTGSESSYSQSHSASLVRVVGGAIAPSRRNRLPGPCQGALRSARAASARIRPAAADPNRP